MSSDAHHRLQPALLDRLTDDSRMADGAAPVDRRVMSRAEMRQAVLRDLSHLFNAVQPLRASEASGAWVADSVLNFGLPPLSGRLASKLDLGVLTAAIHQAIVRFEPRILPETLEVRALEIGHALERHNVIEFEIRGHLWAQPLPLEILLRTQLDLEAGQAVVRDASATAPSARR